MKLLYLFSFVFFSEDGDTYMKEFSNVFPMATNTNFNKQCTPANSCDVIYTSFANYFVSDW